MPLHNAIGCTLHHFPCHLPLAANTGIRPLELAFDLATLLTRRSNRDLHDSGRPKGANRHPRRARATLYPKMKFSTSWVTTYGRGLIPCSKPCGCHRQLTLIAERKTRSKTTGLALAYGRASIPQRLVAASRRERLWYAGQPLAQCERKACSARHNTQQRTCQDTDQDPRQQACR